MWRGDVTVACRTGNHEVAGSTFGRCTVRSLGQVVHSHMPLFNKQYNLLPAKGQWHSAAGKVTIGLALHWSFHRLNGLSTYRLIGHGTGDEHLAYPPAGVWQLCL